MKRLFIGIELPTEIRSTISTYLGHLPRPKKGWENIQDLHITLLFIGETAEENTAIIMDRLHSLKLSTFEIKLTGINFFNRRIMYIKVEPSNQLHQLRSQILSLLSGQYPEEDKEFIPHITIKRWQRYEFQELQQMVTNYPFAPLSFKVDKLALYESRKDEQGNKYQILRYY